MARTTQRAHPADWVNLFQVLSLLWSGVKKPISPSESAFPKGVSPLRSIGELTMAHSDCCGHFGVATRGPLSRR